MRTTKLASANTVTIVIGTHNGEIHADEAFSVASRVVFMNERHTYVRTRDESLLSECDILIDVGMKFDGVKYFDHHQYRHGKSAAGLTWEYIQQELDIVGRYPKIDELVDILDKADTGEAEAPAFSLPFIVKNMNAKARFSSEQEVVFQDIVDFLVGIISSMKDTQDAAYKAESIIETSRTETTRQGKTVLVFEDGMVPGWDYIINGDNDKYSHISIVTWLNKSDGQWKAQVPPIKQGSLELVYDGFTPCKEAIFVHQNQFFSVWNKLEDMLRHQ